MIPQGPLRETIVSVAKVQIRSPGKRTLLRYPPTMLIWRQAVYW